VLRRWLIILMETRFILFLTYFNCVYASNKTQLTPRRVAFTLDLEENLPYVNIRITSKDETPERRAGRRLQHTLFQRGDQMNDKPVKPSVPPAATDKLLGDIRNMIKEARAAVAATVNAGLTMLYWRIGSRINQEVLKGKRGDYGKQILATLSQELARDYGDGFSYTALIRMVKFAECFPDVQIVSTQSRQSGENIVSLIRHFRRESNEWKPART